MGEADDEDDTNPRRISKPGHQSQSAAAVGAARSWSHGAPERSGSVNTAVGKILKHHKGMQDVEAKRARRKEKAKVVTHAKDTIRRAYGKQSEEKDWIQKAVNPKHKGYCTPMSKSTCTPARKALAKRFKKAARKEKKSGGTGWQGKV